MSLLADTIAILTEAFLISFSVSIFFKEDAKNIEITQLQNEILMSDYVEKLKYKMAATF